VLSIKGTVPVLEERDVWGLAIAPESVVRGVLVQAQTGRNRNQLVTLVDGAPITWSESKADIRIHPLDYTTGQLVLLVATQESDLRLLPTNVATRAVCAMSGQLSGKKVRLHRPRGLVHAWGRWTLVVSPPAFDEFDTVPEYTIREWHLDENRNISANAIPIVKRNATPVDLGLGATIQDTLAEFAGDVLELEFNAYTNKTEPMRFVLSVSGWNDVARDSEGGGDGGEPVPYTYSYAGTHETEVTTDGEGTGAIVGISGAGPLGVTRVGNGAGVPSAGDHARVWGCLLVDGAADGDTFEFTLPFAVAMTTPFPTCVFAPGMDTTMTARGILTSPTTLEISVYVSGDGSGGLPFEIMYATANAVDPEPEEE